jgi:CubicO group peptidase (beta-lactamase class C family)
MTAGFPTDDPWGDRQQGLAVDAFERFLTSGPPFAWPPGTTFEYSNLGYGILGRVVTAAGGQEYGDLVRDRILGPLGMASTAYNAADVPQAVSRLNARLGRGVDPRGSDPYGARRRWAACSRPSATRPLGGRVLDAFPRDDPGAATRPARLSAGDAAGTSPRRAFAARRPGPRPPVATSWAMAWPLRPRRHRAGNDVHAGGYPGFGSHMASHPRPASASSARQPPLRTGPPRGRRAAGPVPPAPSRAGGFGGPRRSRGCGRSRRACSSTGTMWSPTGRSR